MAEPIVVSYSELDTFRQCPLKHHLAYRQRWTKERSEDGALGRGTLWHKVLETHYLVIQQHQKQPLGTPIASVPAAAVLAAASKAVMALLFDPQTGAQTPTQELILWMYEGHVKQYGIDEQWQIIAVEYADSHPLLDEHGRKSRYHLKVKIDLIVRNWTDGTLWLIDHKSGKDLPSQQDLDIDDQFGLYTWLMRQKGKPVMGSLHSAARTQRNKSFMPLDTRFSRTYLNRTDRELSNLALDAYRAARAAHPPKGEQRPPYSAPDPRNCGWKCDFKDAHLLMRHGNQQPSEILRDLDFHQDFTRH